MHDSRKARCLALALLALSVCVAVTAAEYPKRKPGLWEITRTPPNPKLPPQVQRICLDAATDALFYQVGESMGRKACSKIDLHNADGKLIVDSICSFGQSQTTSHETISFSGDTAYHTEIDVHYDPPLFGKTKDSHSTQDARWLGACTEDMKPGDMVTQPSAMMPAPLRMNVRDMLKDAASN